MARGYSRGQRQAQRSRLRAAHMRGRLRDPHRAPSAWVAEEFAPHRPFVHGETPARFLFRHGLTLSEERQVIRLDMMVGNGTLIGDT